tara:strand:+ start:169 stop:792 length:624 start_codon:yes stop_codon:yes gene_type:complete
MITEKTIDLVQRAIEFEDDLSSELRERLRTLVTEEVSRGLFGIEYGGRKTGLCIFDGIESSTWEPVDEQHIAPVRKMMIRRHPCACYVSELDKYQGFRTLERETRSNMVIEHEDRYELSILKFGVPHDKLPESEEKYVRMTEVIVSPIFDCTGEPEEDKYTTFTPEADQAFRAELEDQPFIQKDYILKDFVAPKAFRRITLLLYKKD